MAKMYNFQWLDIDRESVQTAPFTPPTSCLSLVRELTLLYVALMKQFRCFRSGPCCILNVKTSRRVCREMARIPHLSDENNATDRY